MIKLSTFFGIEKNKMIKIKKCRHAIIVPNNCGIVKKGQARFCKKCKKWYVK